MKLSTRSRYGMRAILELAIAYGKGAVQVKSIAARQDISTKYLEQLISILKSASLVRSTRGPKGGYTLAKTPSDIKLSEVFFALEGSPIAMDCIEHPEFCPRCADCVTRQVWATMQQAILNVLDEITLQDLADKAKNTDEQNIIYQI
ncbi:MAG: Rrf2 family transcriptional regulator [Planctomycetota bacterium]